MLSISRNQTNAKQSTTPTSPNTRIKQPTLPVTITPLWMKTRTQDIELLYQQYSLSRVSSVYTTFRSVKGSETLANHHAIKRFISIPASSLTEEELDALYNDSDGLSQARFSKSQAIHSIKQERDEREIQTLHDEYKQHQQTDIDCDRKTLQCCDGEECEWHSMKPEPLVSALTALSPKLHVYFYHASMYDEERHCAEIEKRFGRSDATEKTLWREEHDNVDAFADEISKAKSMEHIVHQEHDEVTNTKEECKFTDAECAQLEFLISYGHSKERKLAEAITDERVYEYLDHCIDCHLKLRYEYKCTDGDECKLYNDFVPGQNEDLKQMIHTHFYHNTILNSVVNEDHKESMMLPSQMAKSVTFESSIGTISSSVLIPSISTTKTYDQNMYKIEYKKTLQTMLSNTSQENTLRFGEAWIVIQNDAKFKNPKLEILHNAYSQLKKSEWNDLLKKASICIKTAKAKFTGLCMKELVALKLYTDYSMLQSEYRRCYSAVEESERINRQKQFYYWNALMTSAVEKSQDIITTTLYHGINRKLNASCFTGTYFGPLSTTVKYDVAQGFAGVDGMIIELYPSFGRKGMKISWLSNFPDEEEILYMNTTFNICGIYDINLEEMDAEHEERCLLHTLDCETSAIYEQAILRAIQFINIESKVISLSDAASDDTLRMSEACESNFESIDIFSKLAVLHLLYLQYKHTEWNEFVNSSAALSPSQVALAKYRDIFTVLAINVRAVRMERLSLYLQHFFYSDDNYAFPKCADLADYEQYFQPDQAIRIDKVVRLFPNAQQLLINADNWDWTLSTFIHFLCMFEYEFDDVALQDIYIRFVAQYPRDDIPDNDDVEYHNNRGQELLSKHGAHNIDKLKQYGWRFISATHLHRFGFEPLAELPFLNVFVRSDLRQASLFYRSYSARILNKPVLSSYISSVVSDSSSVELKSESDSEEEEEEGDVLLSPIATNEGKHFVLADHNPKCCVLNADVWPRLEYKDKLIEMMQWTQLKVCQVVSKDQKGFDRARKLVETVVLDPLPTDLEEFFYERKASTKNRSRSIISFTKVFEMFPKVNELFLRKTTFNLRICFQLISFIIKQNSIANINGSNINDGAYGCRLERIFFCKEEGKRTKIRDILKIKARLNKYGWDLKKHEQMAVKLQL